MSNEHGLVLTLFKEVFKGSFEMCVANDISPANLYDDGHYLWRWLCVCQAAFSVLSSLLTYSPFNKSLPPFFSSIKKILYSSTHLFSKRMWGRWFFDYGSCRIGYPYKCQLWNINLLIQGTWDIDERILKMPLEFL